MKLELVQFGTVQLGLKEQGNTAYILSQDLQARLDTPILEDCTNLWQTFLDSRTMQLYGGVNDDQRHRFKIDHSFDLSTIVNADINADGSVTIKPTKYSQSQGTEFVIISRKELNSADKDYAIRADEYNVIKSALNNSRRNKEKYDLTALMLAGGFVVKSDLTPVEVITTEDKTGKVIRVHGGWLELAVGKNNALVRDYSNAVDLLIRYVPEAQKNGCFKKGIGMGWYVETDSNDYKARSWCVYNSYDGSRASDGNSLNCNGRFLRVRGSVAAEGGAPEKSNVIIVEPNLVPAYQQLKDGAQVINSPHGDYVLAKGKIAARQ